METKELPLFERVVLKQKLKRASMFDQHTTQQAIREAEQMLAQMYGKELPKIRPFPGSEHILWGRPGGTFVDANGEVKPIPGSKPVKDKTPVKQIVPSGISSVEDQDDVEETLELTGTPLLIPDKSATEFNSDDAPRDRPPQELEEDSDQEDEIEVEDTDAVEVA
jgi:hypothetical protein